MRIEWSEPAIADLVEIRNFIGLDNGSIAQDVAARIIAAADQLQNFPDSGRIGDEPDSRELVTPQLPYILIYRIAATQIEILRVWHQRENRDAGLD